MEKKSLSDSAIQMLSSGKRVNTLKDREEIKKIFIKEGLPLFDKVIDFQVRFGGIWYKFGEDFYEGFKLDMFYFDEQDKRYRFHGVILRNNKYYFNCMDYHYAGDWGPFIDQDGKIYTFCMGLLDITANSIEEFLDDEAIKFYIVDKYGSWLSRGIDIHQTIEFRENNNLIKIDRDSFSGKYFKWWCNPEETIFIRIDLLHPYCGDIFCKNQKILKQLYKSDVATDIFPSNDIL
ncbi:NADH dehydrogenase [Clostridium mediterraneense]|uniref:NADH dehydrogenase n=1 Tax=Clostridium mediterraneense TaxID=1805472 RepID=UPI00082B3047|nr:NADH dehydrogenase [Clostridium mediterraneense]